MTENKNGNDEMHEPGTAGDGMDAEINEAGSRAEVQLQRAMADLANLRRRMHKEVDEARRRAIEGLAAELLPVIDNFHLALGAKSQADASQGHIDPAAIVDGLRMVKSMLEGVLERHGLSEIQSEGAAFDPNVHEAVGVDNSGGAEPGRVVTVMARGYRLGDRVLRPSRVVVSGGVESGREPKSEN